MKPVFGAMAAIVLVAGGLGSGPASAEVATAAPAQVLRVRLVCNDRRCWHAGKDRHAWYKPYGYYRPYRPSPHVGVGVGVGLFGVGVD